MEDNQGEAKREYEAKKQERLEKRKNTSNNPEKKGSGKNLVRWLISLIILALIAWWAITGVRNNIPKGEDFSQTFTVTGRGHIAVGSANTLPEGTYNSNPPSSGPHYPNTVKVNFYDEPIDDQFIMHNLEHGDIWIAYHPRVSDQVKKELEDLTSRYVIVTPREANDFDISVVAWGRVDGFNLEDGTLPVQRIRDFILRYDNEGPEKVRGSVGHRTTNI